MGSSESFHCVILSKRAASCTWIREENSIEVAHISTTFVRIVFSLVCYTSSYYLELVTELSCLLFYISYFCLHHSFTTTYFSHVCFPQLSVSSGDQAFSNANCRAYHLLVLEIIIFSLFSACLTYHSCPGLCAASTTCLSSAV